MTAIYQLGNNLDKITEFSKKDLAEIVFDKKNEIIFTIRSFSIGDFMDEGLDVVTLTRTIDTKDEIEFSIGCYFDRPKNKKLEELKILSRKYQGKFVEHENQPYIIFSKDKFQDISRTVAEYVPTIKKYYPQPRPFE